MGEGLVPSRVECLHRSGTGDDKRRPYLFRLDGLHDFGPGPVGEGLVPSRVECLHHSGTGDDKRRPYLSRLDGLHDFGPGDHEGRPYRAANASTASRSGIELAAPARVTASAPAAEPRTSASRIGLPSRSAAIR